MASILMDAVDTNEYQEKPKPKNQLYLSQMKENKKSTLIENPQISKTLSRPLIHANIETNTPFSQDGTQKNNSTLLDTSAMKINTKKLSEFSRINLPGKCNFKKQLDLQKMKKIPISTLQMPMKVNRTCLSSLIRATNQSFPALSRDKPQESDNNKLPTSATGAFPEDSPEFSTVHLKKKKKK